tara:strand:- start:471 stop:764 length:294 start_codon:yes stop_codon:yes gene_type:complete
MTTNAKISRAIKERTGLKNVKIYKGGGVCRFYCDETEHKHCEKGIDFTILDSEYVVNINSQDECDWADLFECLLMRTNQWDNITYHDKRPKTKKREG